MMTLPCTPPPPSCCCCCPQVCKLLLREDVDMFILNNQGRTAFHSVFRDAYWLIMEFFTGTWVVKTLMTHHAYEAEMLLKKQNKLMAATKVLMQGFKDKKKQVCCGAVAITESVGRPTTQLH